MSRSRVQGCSTFRTADFACSESPAVGAALLPGTLGLQNQLVRRPNHSFKGNADASDFQASFRARRPLNSSVRPNTNRMSDRTTKFAAAQALMHYEIGGTLFSRVRYGDEEDDWGANRKPCHDCGVVKGQFHIGPGRDVERCPCCGGQAIYCDCDYASDEARS